jgi:hypothetical protein
LSEDLAALVQRIRDGFSRTPHPGDDYLQASREGCEPEEAVAPFRGVTHWSSIPSSLLDAQYTALSFFAEGAFRFFVPAFLVADVRSELQTADSVFHLTGGFHEVAIEVPIGAVSHVRRSGGAVPMNPRRYGAVTYEDYARFRLAVFSREECAAIVSYLAWRRDRDTTGLDARAIDAALAAFWTARAQHAPTTAELERHVEEELRYYRALSAD